MMSYGGATTSRTDPIAEGSYKVPRNGRICAMRVLFSRSQRVRVSGKTKGWAVLSACCPSEPVRHQTTRKRLPVAGHHVVCGYRQGAFSRAVVKLAQFSLGGGDVGLRVVQGIRDGTILIHQPDQPLQIVFGQRAGFHSVFDHLPIGLGAMV